MHYVYILKSVNHDEIYIGLTDDLKRRFAEHNEGKSFHTKKYMPWHMNTDVSFSSREKASNFEKYLKTGSGKAFLRKRLL